jgi:hypothetical protein
MLRPEGATQRQPDARTVVGACSGTYLAETCAISVDHTDGDAVRAKSWTTAHRSGLVASLSVKSLAMAAKMDRRWRPRRRGAGSDAPRRPSDDASGGAARLVKVSRLVRSRRR